MRASLLCRKSSVALLVVGERSENYWKTRSSTQQWPVIVLLARLALKTGQRAFRLSQVTKTLNGDELVPEKQLMQKKCPTLTKTRL